MRGLVLGIAMCLGLMEAQAQVFEVAEDGNLTDGKATENVMVNEDYRFIIYKGGTYATELEDS